jgi:FixJ family two-component response regulator
MTPTEKTAEEAMCLVDDDLAVLKSIGRLLTSGGLAVRVFSKPADFLTHVQAHSVPLVVLDILMEGMSGLEVQAQLRELSPVTRVIIMTGREDATSRSTATELGAIAFFTKPFDDEQFLGAVRRGLAAHSSHA